jgi:hypothetical protein
MKDLTSHGTVICAAIACFAACGSAVGAEKAPAGAEAPGGLDHRAAPYPNCVRIFNGVSFDGWEADPSTWSIVDGAMRGRLSRPANGVSSGIEAALDQTQHLPQPGAI